MARYWRQGPVREGVHWSNVYRNHADGALSVGKPHRSRTSAKAAAGRAYRGSCVYRIRITPKRRGVA
jgi:hypothetical protein